MRRRLSASFCSCSLFLSISTLWASRSISIASWKVKTELDFVLDSFIRADYDVVKNSISINQTAPHYTRTYFSRARCFALIGRGLLCGCGCPSIFICSSTFRLVSLSIFWMSSTPSSTKRLSIAACSALILCTYVEVEGPLSVNTAVVNTRSAGHKLVDLRILKPLHVLDMPMPQLAHAHVTNGTLFGARGRQEAMRDRLVWPAGQRYGGRRSGGHARV